MNHKSPRELEDEQRLAERAAEWLSVLKNANTTEQTEFADWLTESPRHLEEFLFTTALDKELDRISLQGNARIQEILARASERVVPLRNSGVKTSLPGLPPARSGRMSDWRLRWAAGVAALMAIASVVLWQVHSRGQTYATAVGEQRSLRLADGSVIHLTARTRAQVRFSSGARDIELLEGEAMFKVARDTSRPFRVYSAGSVIQAIGTQFNVRQRPSGTTVSVIEGVVQIEKQDAGVRSVAGKEIAPAKLRAGEEARIALNGRVENRTPIDVVTVVGWRQRRLVFRADTLTDIAAEFNRYNRVPQLVVEGDATVAPRYTGVFDADDPLSLLAFLREDPQIVLKERGDVLVIHPR